MRDHLRELACGRPRLSVHRSLRYIYAQVIDDSAGKTVAFASSLSREIKAKLKPKKSSISMDMLATANTYDDKVALIRMLVAEDSGRVANVLKGMIKVN